MCTLEGKKGLILGIANEQSIAWPCAQAMQAAGALLGATWQTEKSRTYVEPLLDALGVDLRMPLDVSDDAQLEAVFDAVAQRWGRLDFLIHSIAYAPKDDLHGKVLDSSREGFALAMDISCHSFIRAARLAAPLMSQGGSLVAMSYLGSERVVPNYGLMGPVKAALESAVRYLAAELGPVGIRVNAISPGAIETRAASGIKHFDALVTDYAERSPMVGALTANDVAPLCVFLASDGARAMTGATLYVDGGYNIVT